MPACKASIDVSEETDSYCDTGSIDTLVTN